MHLEGQEHIRIISFWAGENQINHIVVSKEKLPH